MRQSRLGTIAGVGLSLFSGCAQSLQPKIYWNAEPTNVRYIIDAGRETFVRTRELIDYVDSEGNRQSITLTEENIPETNRWRIIAAERPKNGRLYDALRKRLPGLAEVLTDPTQSIGCIEVEDIYNNHGERIGTSIHLPNGVSEEF